MDDRQLLDQQMAYYRARAEEYDEWFLREKRYDRGPEHRRQWFREVEEMERVLRSTVQGEEVLELACGTGLWTQRLAENNRRIVALDASPEVIAINRERVQTGNVEYSIADIFSWVPPNTSTPSFSHFGCRTFPTRDLMRSGHWSDRRSDRAGKHSSSTACWSRPRPLWTTVRSINPA